MDPAEELSELTTASNAVLSIRSVNYGNNKGKFIDSVAILSTMLVEPAFKDPSLWKENKASSGAEDNA